MKRDVTAFQYMRAHGNSPGPTQRPRLTGAISGAIAAIPALLIRYLSGALGSEAEAVGHSLLITGACGVLFSIVAGIIYSAIFQRAANDIRGGWLFGSSYGFLIWMIGPVSIWQWITGRPLAAGTAAMGMFGAYVVYGLTLGAVYPLINRLLQTRLKQSTGSSATS
jgi:hypothetical protein